MEKYLFAVDLGTSSCKTALFNEELRIVASSYRPYPTSYPEVNWAEQSAEIWWTALKETTKEVLSISRIDPSSIAGIGIDAMGSVMLPVDAEGTHLRPGLLWMDRRSEQQCQESGRIIAEPLARINGNHNDPSNVAPKILWFKECEPDLYQQTAIFLHANGYLVKKLTGQFSMDYTEGGLTQLFDTKNGIWSEELIDAYGIDKRKLPPVFHSTDIVGTVTGEAAAEIGLREGTSVIAGSMDMVAAALGSGSVRNGDLYVSGGTVTAAGLCLDKPLFHPDLHVYHHIIPGIWLSAAGVDYGGAGVKWLKDLLELDDYSTLDALVEADVIPSQPLLFLPYMVGQRAPLWNSHTRGVLVGLHPSSGRKEIARAMMEGNALGVRRLLDLYRESGQLINRFKLTGGCANSIPWSQIMADIAGLDVGIPGQMDVAVLGTAITTGVGVGLFDDFKEAEELLEVRKQYKPNQSNSSYYDRMYILFLELYEQMLGTYYKMKELRDDLSGTCPDGS